MRFSSPREKEAFSHFLQLFLLCQNVALRPFVGLERGHHILADLKINTWRRRALIVPSYVQQPVARSASEISFAAPLNAF